MKQLIILALNETPHSKLRGISPRLTSFVISLLRSRLRGMPPLGFNAGIATAISIIQQSKDIKVVYYNYLIIKYSNTIFNVYL